MAAPGGGLEPTMAETGPRVTIPFTTSFAEQVAVSRHVVRFSRGWWVGMITFGAIPFVLAVPKAIGGLAAEAALLALIAACGLVFWNHGISWLAVRAARAAVRSPDGPYTWIIDETGCRLEEPTAVVTLRWAAIVDVRETPDAFLLHLNQTTAHFIPKQAVAEADLPILRQLLEQRTR